MESIFDTTTTVELLKSKKFHKKKIYIFSYEPLHFYFVDYIESIIHYLPDIQLILYSRNNYCYEYIKENNISNSIVIFIQFFLIIRIESNDYYLLNTEQLTVDKWYKGMKVVCDRKINIIDYSTENIKIMKNYDPSAKIFHLPYLYNPHEKFYDIPNDHNKPYDVGFISTDTGLANSERRTHIYEKLCKVVKVNLIGGFKEVRDKELSKCKILINIHFKPTYKVLETFRCYRCIYNKMLIVSEDIQYSDTYYLDEHIIFAKYENVIDKVVEVINNYDYYYNKIYKNFDEIHVKNHCEKIAENFSNL